MPTALDGIRVEVSASPPLATTRVWRDVTTRTRLDSGISISRGRRDEWSDMEPSRCTLTLDNEDGALTPGGAYGMKPGSTLRVSWRDPSTPGNLVDADSASFEGANVGSWASTWLAGPAPVTLASASSRFYDGARSMRITWPTAAAGCSPQLYLGGLILGRTYTAQARIWIIAGSPAVAFGDLFGYTPTVTTTTTSQWQLCSVTWTATTTAVYLGVRATVPTTAGQQAWVDAVMVDEADTAAAFTTAAPVVNTRFTGYVDEWPVQWPTGGDNYSSVTVTALDLLARMGRMPELGSVIEETLRLDGPRFYFPLDEGEGSTSVGCVIGSGSTLNVSHIGSGGELTLGSATGPPTDGRAAPQFTPASSTSGYYLSGSVAPLGGWYGAVSVEVAFLTSASVDQTLWRMRDAYGTSLTVGTTAAGKARVSFLNVWTGDTWSVTSAATVSNGSHHHVAVTMGTTAGVATLTLYVDGTSAGSVAIPGVWATLSLLEVGGTSDGSLFTGTVSHVAGYLTVLSAVAVAEHSTAIATGYAGERADQREARVLTWAGVPAAFANLDTTEAVVGHAECTGWTPAEYLQRLAATQGAPLFVDGSGVLRQHSRARLYDATASLTVSADSIDPDSLTMTLGLDGLANAVTVTRLGGATQRLQDSASIAAYGTESASLEVLYALDSDALTAATWRLSRGSEPSLTTPQIGLDPLTDTANTAAILALDIGSLVVVTGLPSQAPSSSVELVVQGYTESIGTSGWYVTPTTSTRIQVLILDDATYGGLDTYPLAY